MLTPCFNAYFASSSNVDTRTQVLTRTLGSDDRGRPGLRG